MAPAAYLTRQMADGAGERILDLCAAPGGKSTQIAAAMAGRGILISNEIHPARAKILSENIERMGIANAVVTNETPQRLAEHFSEYFTRIMVDAPCSGEGMFRKNEEACEQWSTQNVELCADRQDEILDCAASMLAGETGLFDLHICTGGRRGKYRAIPGETSGILRGGGAACGGNVARTGRTFRDDPSVAA